MWAGGLRNTVNTPSPEGGGFSAKLRGNPHASRPKAGSRPLDKLQHVAGGFSRIDPLEDSPDAGAGKRGTRERNVRH